MFGIPEWFIIVAVFGLAIAYVFVTTLAHYDPEEIPESDVPFHIALGSTESEMREYRELASRNRSHFGCVPGTRRSTTCPFKNTDARNDYKCGWCCVPARKRNYLPL
jgi:hypothetical protein